MAKLASREEMLKDGWFDVVINGVDCIKLEHPGDYTMIAQWSRDGFTTQQAARLIQQELGQAYKIHTLWDKRDRNRISCLEYI